MEKRVKTEILYPLRHKFSLDVILCVKTLLKGSNIKAIGKVIIELLNNPIIKHITVMILSEESFYYSCSSRR